MPGPRYTSWIAAGSAWIPRCWRCRGAWTAAWRQFCRKLGARGVARAPHEGPRDYAERAARRLPSAGEAIRGIAALYIALRYGRSAPSESVVQLRRMVRDLTFG